jgi:tRNA (guanine37-N1)-methyltransferase
MARWARGFATWSRNFLTMNSPNLPELFLPPVKRDMHVLDRSFFKKTIPLSAATVFDNRDLQRVRKELSRSGDILSIDAIKVTRDDETVPGKKCMLLNPAVVAQGMVSRHAALLHLLTKSVDPSTWSAAIMKLVEERVAGLRPYPLTLTYEDWTMRM